MLREDSYRTGTADSPVCQCGFGTESAEHYLLYCTRFQEARHKLLDKLADSYESTSSNKSLHLSEELFLAPKTDLVTRKHNFWIKDALLNSLLIHMYMTEFGTSRPLKNLKKNEC